VDPLTLMPMADAPPAATVPPVAWRVQAIEERLAHLAADIALGTGLADRRLRGLAAQAWDLERSLLAHPLRLAACRAQAALLRARLTEPERCAPPGLQVLVSLEVMLARRTPARPARPEGTLSGRLLRLADEIAAVCNLLLARSPRGRSPSAAARHAPADRRAALQARLLRSAAQLSHAGLVYCLAGMAGYLDLDRPAAAGGTDLPGDLMVGFGLPVLMLPVRRSLQLARRQTLAAWPRTESSASWEPPWNDTTPCTSGLRPPTARLPATPPATSGARVRRWPTGRLPRVRSPSPHWSARRR
jgi:uncharacterized membrane-anchored protein